MESERGQLREQMKERRRALALEEIVQKSASVREAVLAMPEVEQTELVCMYLSYGREVDTRPLVAQFAAMGKRVAVPKVLGPGAMEFYYIQSLADCVPGAYGILEPKEGLTVVQPDFVLTSDIADVTAGVMQEKISRSVMLLPGLAFDQNGARMGYGGGYYDRYLTSYPQFTKIALAYEFSVFSKLPTEPHDIPVDYIITEEKIWKSRAHIH